MRKLLNEDIARRRATKHLRIALRDHKSDLACDWARRDPDFDSMRTEKDADWKAVICGYCGEKRGRRRGDPPWDDLSANAPRLAEGLCQLHGVPRNPWGPSWLAVWTWAVLVLATVAAGGIAIAMSADQWQLYVALGLAGAVALIRAVRASNDGDRVKLLREAGERAAKRDRASPDS